MQCETISLIKFQPIPVSRQVMINPFCGLSVIFCGFISHLIGRETINIPEIFSGVHGFTGKAIIIKQITFKNQNTTKN